MLISFYIILFDSDKFLSLQAHILRVIWYHFYSVVALWGPSLIFRPWFEGGVVIFSVYLKRKQKRGVLYYINMSSGTFYKIHLVFSRVIYKL